MAKSVVGLFDSQRDAQAALNALHDAGFRDDSIQYVEQAGGRFQPMLIDAGIPEQDAAIYADGVRQGGTLIMLQALNDDDALRAADILNTYNVVDITRRVSGYDHSRTTRDTSTTGFSSAYQGGDTVIPIIEEELRVGKRGVDRGGVRVDTHVEEVPVNEQVTLRDETIDVHRVRQERPVTEADLANLREGTIEVREHDEEAIIDKQARVVEEVHIRKDVEERTENIQDTVRRTDVDVEQLGGQTRTAGTGYSDTTRSDDRGLLDRGKDSLTNAAERATNKDLDNDQDVGGKRRR